MATDFTSYLEEQFMEEYHGTKDTFEASFDRWLSELDGSQFIEYADEWGELKLTNK